MRKLALTTILLAVTAGSVFAGRSLAEPKEAVRYIDVQRCLVEWTDLQDRSTAVREQFSGLSDQFRQRQEMLAAQEEELVTLNPALPAVQQQAFELQLARETLKAQVEFSNKNYNDMQSQILEEGVRRIHEIAATIGEREGYSAIMMHPNPLEPIGAQFSVRDSITEMNGRWVLWSNSNYDLSDEVLQQLNQKQ
ncbi:MAG: OmpH family outer membrane protein [Planctomycetota bacterium]